jgi:hypothetical protein
MEDEWHVNVCSHGKAVRQLLRDGEIKKNALKWRFPCILVAAWEGHLHTLKFIYTAPR